MRATMAPLGTAARHRAAGAGASPSRQASVGSKTRSAARSPISATARRRLRGPRTGRIVPPMSVFTKVLRAGEGKKVRRLAELVPPINALEPEMQAPQRRRARRTRRSSSGSASTRARRSTTCSIEAFAVVREAAWRVLGQRHFDVQLMGGMALHFGWIAEMKTGEGKTLVSTLPVYLNALDGRGVHMVTVNDYLATRDAEWMGRVHRWLGLTVGPDRPRHRRPGDQAGRLRLRTSPTGPTPSSASTTCATTWPASREHMAQRGPRLRHRRRGRLHPDRRGPDAAHHLGPGRRGGAALLPVRLHRPHAHPRRRLRGRRGEEDGRPARVGDREGGEGRRRREHLRRRLGQLRAPADQGAHGQGPLPAGQGLPRRRRRGEDRRRVHRPHAGGAAVVRRSPPGRRGQGAGDHQGGEPHLGHGDAAELLPPVREVGRHDRDGRDRGRRVRRHLRPAGGARSRPTRTWSALDEPDLVFKTEEAKFNAVVDDIVERHEHGPADARSARRRWPSPSCCRGCSRSAASRTTCSTPSSTSGRPRSWPRPGGAARVTVATNMAGRGVDIILGGNAELLAAARAGGRGRRPRQRGGRGRAGPAPGRHRGALPGRGRGGAQARRPLRARAASATRAGASTTSCAAVRAARATRARAAST